MPDERPRALSADPEPQAAPRGDRADQDDILAIGAHPDDIEAVAGGTIAKLARRGTRTLLVDLSSAPQWPRFDFAVDVTEVYDVKLAALAAYESVFSGAQAELLDRYGAEDRYIGGLVGVRYAEAFRARSPLLVDSPDVFLPVRFG